MTDRMQESGFDEIAQELRAFVIAACAAGELPPDNDRPIPDHILRNSRSFAAGFNRIRLQRGLRDSDLGQAEPSRVLLQTLHGLVWLAAYTPRAAPLVAALDTGRDRPTVNSLAASLCAGAFVPSGHVSPLVAEIPRIGPVAAALLFAGVLFAFVMFIAVFRTLCFGEQPDLAVWIRNAAVISLLSAPVLILLRLWPALAVLWRASRWKTT